MRVLLVLLATLVVTPAPADAAWRWPVRGEVVTPFATGPDPFAPGQHRGIDVAARPGAAVVAPCSGTVRFAGRLPKRARAVTIACGDLVATVLELATTTARRGATIPAGTQIGTVAASHVQLGARRAGHRHRYIDPLTLLAEEPAPPPLTAPPGGPSGKTEGRRGRPPAAARPLPTPGAARAPAARPSPVPPTTSPVDTPPARPAGASSPAGWARVDAPGGRAIPVAAWVGLVLLAAATPVGLWRRRERGRGKVVAATTS